MNISDWLKNNASILKGKTVAITGSTGGLGKAICNHLAALSADLILLDRNIKKSTALGVELQNKYPQISVRYITVDMEDIDSVITATEELCKMNIDFFISNAGAYNIPKKNCSTGFDNIFQINFISPYYIIKNIMPSLKRRNGKVIAVGSIAYMLAKLSKDNYQRIDCKNAEAVYGNSKRFLMFALYELFKNESEVSLAIVHPGITYTNLMSNYPKWISNIIKYPMKIIFMSPQKASLSIIKGLFSDCNTLEWIGPRFFNIWGTPVKSTLKDIKPEEYSIIETVTKGIDLL